MEFKFSKKEELLQWAVNDFAQGELATNKLDTLDHVPEEIIRKIGEIGFFSMRIPEKYGGKPATWVMVGILAEEIAKANISIANLIMVSYAVSISLSTNGTEEAKEEWLSKLAKGDKLGCISLTEPDNGSDISSIQTKAIRKDDIYLLSGEKSMVSFGTQADVAILFARTSIEKESNGVTAFLVPLNLLGVTKLPIIGMGLLPSRPASFVLNGVSIAVDYRIGQEGEGPYINRNTGLFSDLNHILSGLVSLGLAQTAMKSAIAYGKRRVAFGRPIVQFEAVSEKIAEDATLIEAGRWLCYRALWLKDQNLPNTREAAMCGWWCPKVAFQVIEDALLIHGHSGYSDELPFQQMLRDITAFEMMTGTEEILKLTISQNLIGRVALPFNLTGNFD
jgi:cyclohexanecarboxyl-CoA dehydrogenase